MWMDCWGDYGGFVEMCGELATELEPSMQELQRAVVNRDLEAARSSAHRLKGTMAMARLRCAKVAKDLDGALRDATWAQPGPTADLEEHRRMAAQLAAEVNVVLRQLRGVVERA